MGILIKNGTIVTSVNEYKADILVEGEKIVSIGENLDSGSHEVVDACGMYVLPGGVDQHTHFDALCNVGDRDTRGYETTDAAIVGGTTTIVEYAPQEPGKGLIDSIIYRRDKRAKGKIAVDFSFHALVTEVSDKIFDEIPQLPKYGVPSVKMFMAYKGSPLYVDDGSLYKALLAAKTAGVTVFVHAENADITDILQKQCVSEGKVEPKYHAVSRPPFVESEATIRALNIAKAADAPIFVVHVTCKEAMEAIRDAWNRGQAAYGETCSHYLTLSVDNLYKPEFEEAAKYICSPALRTPEHHEALWNALQKGWLKAVASDHCGIDIKGMKDYGRNDFSKIPNGSPSVENRLAILWTYGVEKGKISRQRLVDVFATAPAKFNGIFPRKGHIDVGCDADIVVFDPKWKGTISNETSLHQVDYCIFEGMEQIGRAEKVYLRGKLVADNGKFVGVKGQGQYINGEAYGSAYQNL